MARRLSAGSTEADARSAISRAYYASYHQANGWASKLPFPGSFGGRAGGSHQQLANGLQQPDQRLPPALSKASRKLGMILTAGKTRRHKADYDLGKSISPMEVDMTIKEAESILQDYP